jgi:hypothetical protein
MYGERERKAKAKLHDCCLLFGSMILDDFHLLDDFFSQFGLAPLGVIHIHIHIHLTLGCGGRNFG